MNLLEYLGVPTLYSWFIIAMLLFMSGFQIYNQLSFKFSKKCRSCGKYAGSAMLCNDCFNGIRDIVPKDWSNKK